MACLNGPLRASRQRRQQRGAKKRAKWGFQLDLLEDEQDSASGSGRGTGTGTGSGGGSGTHTSSSEWDGSSASDSLAAAAAAMPPISRFILEGSKLETKMNRLNSQHGRGTFLEGGDYSATLTFTPRNFLSCSMLKRLTPWRGRRQEEVPGREDSHVMGQRGVTGVMLPADRFFQLEALKSFEGRKRLLAEMEYLDHVRGIRRPAREVVPHRAHLDLFLGGKKMEVEERFDLSREISRLKAMAMPVKARDLYHGRGIALPPTHMSLVPRPPVRAPVVPELDADDLRLAAQPTVHRSPDPSLTFEPQLANFENRISVTLGDTPRTRSVIKGKRLNQLPSINKSMPAAKPEVKDRRSPILLAKEKRTVTNLQARLNLSRLPRDDTSLSKSQSSVPHSSRSAAWVEEQNELLARSPKKGGREREEQRPSYPQPVTMPVTQKGGSPEPPPPTTEGGPRPTEEALSGASQKTPNPLKAGLDLEVSEEQMSSLRQTFQRLDTDMDGHLRFDQLQSRLPEEFSRQQEDFVKQVYDITHSSAEFFGVDEFMMLDQLTKRVASLTGPAHDAFGKMEFESLEKSIIRYVDLFHWADSAQRGKISTDKLREVIGRSQNTTPLEESSPVWDTIIDSLCLDYTSHVTKIEYLAHVPLFLTMAPPAPK
ncbi:uncharacterized protein LOC143283157 isoform X2 [Babylonia areolata]|uniref:uncharacterized protein LOC143283157 isoform X2 n=1 Tax=Babylonia areolata TaxID=304850 RepID=UPI003FCF0B91